MIRTFVVLSESPTCGSIFVFSLLLLLLLPESAGVTHERDPVRHVLSSVRSQEVSSAGRAHTEQMLVSVLAPLGMMRMRMMMVAAAATASSASSSAIHRETRVDLLALGQVYHALGLLAQPALSENTCRYSIKLYCQVL